MDIKFIAGVLLGNGLAIGAAAILFGRGQVRLANSETITKRLGQEIPGFRAGACDIATDGHTALVEDVANRGIVLVKTLGKGHVVRKLSRNVLNEVTRRGALLSLRLADFTYARADIELHNESLAREWETRLRERR